jgi:FtsZ-binding cell division protein ZapB
LEIVILEKLNNNVQMKNLLLFLLISTTSFAQNKKEQIEILNFRVDSLNTVLETTRANSDKDISLLNDKIKEISEEVTALQGELTTLQASNNELSKGNEKLKTDLGELSKENDKLKTDLGELSKKKLELEAKSNANTEKTIYQLLQGTWQSYDDPKSVIEFKDQYYIDYYDNEKIDENKFWLDKSCPDTGESGKTGENEKYLVVDDMCWFINDVTESLLDLTYTSRGNTLMYKKIKK